MLIATSFRDRVTVTVLLLLGHSVSAQCLLVVAYRSGEDGFVDLRQVMIAAPGVGKFMIGVAGKDSERRAESGKKKHTLRAQRHAFWIEAFESLRKRVRRFETAGSSKPGWRASPTR